jgi:hypothetical protein
MPLLDLGRLCQKLSANKFEEIRRDRTLQDVEARLTSVLRRLFRKQITIIARWLQPPTCSLNIRASSSFGRDRTRLLDKVSSCSKLSADEFPSDDTRRDSTTQDSSSTFQQALYASFF